MSEWIKTTLAEIADIRVSNVDKKSYQSEKPVMLCNYMDVYSNDYITRNISFMEATATIMEIAKFTVSKGDVLITKDSETPFDIGIPAVVEDDIDNLICGYHLAQFRPDFERVDPVFLAKKLSMPDVSSYFSRVAAGSTRYGLSYSSIANVVISLPSLERQKSISGVLKNLDYVIEKTEKIIEKYNKIKFGIMCDFFTRGINSDGKLRESYDHMPHLYQDSEIGFIPKGWSTHRLDKLLAPVVNNFRSGPFGSALLKSELVEEGIPFLGIDNIHVENFDARFKRFVSEKKFNELIRYAVRPKDVVITIMGTVGRSAVIPHDIGLALSSKHLWTMTFDQNLVIPELVCWQLNFAPWVKYWFRKETQGGIMDAIQSKTLKSLILPLPPIEEQNLIYEKYLVITKKIQAEEKILKKLMKEKEGLMNDLLTGKISVQLKQKETGATHV